MKHIKNNYDFIIIFLILFFHFLYLLNLYQFPIYLFYDYYLKIPTSFQDFFWFPSNALINNINVYELYFEKNNIREYLPGYPPPNYSILHTIIFLPFGFFSFETSKKIYLLVNMFLLFNIYQIFKNYYKNNKIFYLYIFFLFSPLLIHLLKVGQYTIFCLWGFIIYFYKNKNQSLQFIGFLISTLKYTFAPIISLYLLFEGKLKILFISIVLNIIAIIFYSLHFNISFELALANPILMGWKAQAIGVGDLLSFLGNHPQFPFNIMVVALFFFFLKYFIYFNTKRVRVFDLILICVLSLMSFKHLNYDYIVIFPAILLIFEKINNKSKIILSCIVFYFLFILPCFLIEPMRYTKYFIFFNLLLNLILLAITLELILKKKIFNYLDKQYNKK